MGKLIRFIWIRRTYSKNSGQEKMCNHLFVMAVFLDIFRKYDFLYIFFKMEKFLDGQFLKIRITSSQLNFSYEICKCDQKTIVLFIFSFWKWFSTQASIFSVGLTPLKQEGLNWIEDWYVDPNILFSTFRKT